MSTQRTYPRTDDEYPEIMSKADPLIIRVNPTVLLVGSTTYTAKVKQGIRFTGFLVYVSAIGIPIYKEEVDTSGKSEESTSPEEPSEAWSFIHDKARDWMDILEQSMILDNKEKNIVDLLREIKFQMHFDLSGHKSQAETYGESLEICTEQPVYVKEIMDYLNSLQQQMSYLNDKVDTLNDYIGGEQGLNNKIEILEGSVDGIHTTLGKTNQDGIWKTLNTIDNSVGTITNALIADSPARSLYNAITQGYASIASAIDTQTGKIINLTTEVETVKSRIGDGTNDSTTTLWGTVNHQGTLIEYINTQVTTNTEGTLLNKINYIRNAKILTMDEDHVGYLNYWGQDMYDSTHANLYGKFHSLLTQALVENVNQAKYSSSTSGFDTYVTNQCCLRICAANDY